MIGILDCKQQKLTPALLNKEGIISKIMESSRMHKEEAEGLGLGNGTRATGRSVVRQLLLRQGRPRGMLRPAYRFSLPFASHPRVKVQERAYSWSSFMYPLLFPPALDQGEEWSNHSSLHSIREVLYVQWQGFPGGSVVKNPPAFAGDTGSIPGSGRSPGGMNGNPLQYSCLENPMDRGAWWTIVLGVVKSWTWLNEHTQTHIYTMGNFPQREIKATTRS